jgi:hypothetical protein
MPEPQKLFPRKKKKKERAHLGGVEGRLQGHADGAPEVDAAYDAEHGPLLPGEHCRARLRAHAVWPQPRRAVSFILCKTQHNYAYSFVIRPGVSFALAPL